MSTVYKDLRCSGCLKALPNPEQWPPEHFQAACDDCRMFIRPGLDRGAADRFWSDSEHEVLRTLTMMMDTCWGCKAVTVESSTGAADWQRWGSFVLSHYGVPLVEDDDLRASD